MSGHNNKKCSSCHEYKKLSMFNDDVKSKDDLYHRCRSCHSKYNKIWRDKNRERCISKTKAWRQNNKTKVNEYRRKYYRKRYENDINFRLSYLLSGSVNRVINNKLKSGSAVRDLGCTIGDFKKHIESKFSYGMTWENYGNGENKWNIDHIKPVSLFNLSDRDEFLKAVHFSNMQPMWFLDNCIKGNKEESQL